MKNCFIPALWEDLQWNVLLPSALSDLRAHFPNSQFVVVCSVCVWVCLTTHNSRFYLLIYYMYVSLCENIHLSTDSP